MIQYQHLDFYKTLFLSKGYFIQYKRGWKKREKKSRRKHCRKQNLDNFVARKVDKFAVHEKFGSIDKFKLKVFDQILDICHLKKCEAVEKEIETGELDCTNGVANISAML